VSPFVAAGYHVVRFGQGDVDVWAGLMASHFVKEAVPEFTPLVARADRLYNEALFAGDRSERAYREFFVAVRYADDHDRLRASPFLNAPSDEPARKVLAHLADALTPVVDRLRNAESQWSATAELARALQADRDRLALEALELQSKTEKMIGVQEELRAALRFETAAAEDAEAQVEGLVRHSQEIVASASRVREELDRVSADLTAVRAHRDLLASRVTTLERRQRVAKWVGMAVILCTLVAIAAYRLAA